MPSKAATPGLFNPAIIRRAVIDALRKLDPRELMRNPVIFVTEVVSAVVTVFFVRDVFAHNGVAGFSGQIAAWLWFTVLFANFAEAVAEGRGKAQADAPEPNIGADARIVPFSAYTLVSGIDLPGRSLRKGAVDAILAEMGSTTGPPSKGFASAGKLGGAQPAAPSAANIFPEQTGLQKDYVPVDFTRAVERIARSGGTPLAVSENGRLLGVVHLKDIVKPEIKVRSAALRAMGIKTVMVTGDNTITAGSNCLGSRRR